MTSGPTSATRTSEGPSDFTVVVATQEGTAGRQFLMVRNRERGWELPGGKLEGKEGPVHCALREFREETGHLLADPRFVAKLPKKNGTCFVFTGRLGAKVFDVAENEVVGGLRWYQRLPQTGLAFPDDPYEEIGDALGIEFR